MPDAVTELAEYIRRGLPATGDSARTRLKRLFTSDGPYLDRRDTGDAILRDAYGLANDEGIPWAGLVHPANAPSGVYGGASLVWFPTENRSLDFRPYAVARQVAGQEVGGFSATGVGDGGSEKWRRHDS